MNQEKLKGLYKTYDFPETLDIRKYDCLKLTLKTEGRKEVWVDVTMYPLLIGRPEFIEKTQASLFAVIEGETTVEIPFAFFDYRHLFDAHLKYMDHIEIFVNEAKGNREFGKDDVKSSNAVNDSERKVTLEETKYSFIDITNMEFGYTGDFHISIDSTSRVGEVHDKLVFPVQLANNSDSFRIVNIRKEWHGKEIAPFTYEKLVSLAPGEKKVVELITEVPESFARGGRELHTFHFLPDGERGEQSLDLYVARRSVHPFILHTEAGWNQVKNSIAADQRLQKSFNEQYLKPAVNFDVPQPSDNESYVYASPTQEDFLRVLIAWKISGRKDLKQKALQYIKGFLDTTKGYLTTKQSYFIFIESKEEYRKGDFKVNRACSAGWIQEAEFMTKIAVGYDLLYKEPEFTAEMHRQMEACMRTYIDFASWRLSDGDGNNFQIAEASSGLLFSMILQDYEQITRFLDGKNGLKDIMGSVFSDEGSYFEGASNYIRLAGEILQNVAIGCENFGINLKDVIVPATFDKPVLHSPWALRAVTAEDGKPFLGMSFDKTNAVMRPYRRLKDHFDDILMLLNDKGILFSANDSNEQNFIRVMEKAYYMYHDEKYKSVTKLAEVPDILYGEHMCIPDPFELGKKSTLSRGYGFAVLRNERKKEQAVVQAVLKYGQHGGYHGHFDRLSLVSFIRDNKNFHNMEYTWFGYDSFLFKMWVQTSMAHNMVVVDDRMQEPGAGTCIYFEDNEKFQAACVETVSRWSDPPYGGQTPYPIAFPDEKCRLENRYVLPSEVKRSQGEIGEYSEPIFQRRLVVLVEDICFVWDYEAAESEHIYDCLYHPLGKLFPSEFTKTNLTETSYTERLDENPFGSGQFVRGCYWHEGRGTVKLAFKNKKKRQNNNDIIDFIHNTDIYRCFPTNGEVMIGWYPEKCDTFTEEETKALPDVRWEESKKTVLFRQKGKEARFVTAIQIGDRESNIEEITAASYSEITVRKAGGDSYTLHVSGMEDISRQEVKVRMDQ